MQFSPLANTMSLTPKKPPGTREQRGQQGPDKKKTQTTGTELPALEADYKWMLNKI